MPAQPDETMDPAGDSPCAEAATERAALTGAIERREALLRGVAGAAEALLTSGDDLAVAIPRALASLGEASAADRVSVYRRLPAATRDGDQVVCPYEWTQPGVLRHSELPGRFPVSCCSFGEAWRDRLQEGQALQAHTAQMPDALRALKERDGTRSVLVVPIVVRGEFWGVLSFDNCHTDREWSPATVSTIETAASLLAGAVERDTAVAARLEAERRRIMELAAANDVLARTSTHLASQPDLSSFLSQLVLETTRQLGAASGYVVLIDDNGEQRRAISIEDGVISEPRLVAATDVAEARALELLRASRQPRQFDIERDLDVFCPEARAHFRQRGVRVLVATALQAGDRLVGFLGLAFREHTTLDAISQQLLRALAQQAALAIQLTRLAHEAQEQARQAAVLEERNRLAREIHDTMAQGFAAIAMQLQGVRRHGGPLPQAVAASLDQVMELARENLLEARRSVLALRPRVLDGAGLPDALSRLVHGVQRGASIPLALDVTGTPAAPEAVEHEVVRIAQEALTNAVRHAGASRIWVRLAAGDRGLRLIVGDDGRGFAHDGVTHGDGLRGMQERAERIGASFTIVTEPGGGTELILAWADEGAGAGYPRAV
ncbi:MAG: GAF domain-containing sensor histidine kinase [Vicinamibacterales bacterium]|nr:GAF domain-containing sensor histidine kinase [Vicinamibacterales bacterium]